MEDDETSSCSSISSCDEVSDKTFLIISSTNGTRLSKCRYFHRAKALGKFLGVKPKIFPQPNGNLLVKVPTSELSARLLTLTVLDNIPIQVQPYETLCFVKGVVFAPEMVTYDMDKLIADSAIDGVINIERVNKLVDGVLTPTSTLFLTFDRQHLPKKIYLGLYQFEVKQFVPTPRRCFHCQHYGHLAKVCLGRLRGTPSICQNCGGSAHGKPQGCKPKCVNCGEAHSSASKKCKRYKLEFEMQMVRFRDRLSVRKAKARVRTGTSFGS